MYGNTHALQTLKGNRDFSTKQRLHSMLSRNAVPTVATQRSLRERCGILRTPSSSPRNSQTNSSSPQVPATPGSDKQQ